MKRYVVGFVFTPDFKQVLFVLKNRPDWQVGKLNGIGGKIESDESDVRAMVRECQEECALKTKEADWQLVCTMTGPEWEVVFFGAIWTDDRSQAKTMTDEAIDWYATNPLPNNIIVNLRWLVPLAMNKLQAVDELSLASVQYRV